MNDSLQIIKFIRELYNQPTGTIPLHAPIFIGNEKRYVNECIDTTFVSSIGKFVDQFEEKIAEYTGVRKAVSCVNGTNALHLALRLVGVGEHTEVITQPLTFIATANAISYCHANPVFIDVDRDTMGLSPNALLKFLETHTYKNQLTNKTFNKLTHKQISACVPMHTFGHPCKINEIIDICELYNIPVIEDAAESMGSYFNGKHTGSFGKIGVLSFNGNKIITAGGGGVLLFMDEELGKRAKHLTTQAKIPHPWEFVHDEIGYNLRLPNINAALGLAQLEQLPKFLLNKRETADRYKAFFRNTEHLFISEPLISTSNYWLNAILCKSKESKESLLAFTNANGVMTRPIWQLMNKLEMFSHCQCADIPNAEWLNDRIINLPSSVRL